MNLLSLGSQGAAQFLPARGCPPLTPGPSGLCFSDPVCVLCLNHGPLSLVLRLGTHCACCHGHWEALSAMCFKGNLSPPSARSPLPAPGELTMSGSSEPGL